MSQLLARMQVLHKSKAIGVHAAGGRGARVAAERGRGAAGKGAARPSPMHRFPVAGNSSLDDPPCASDDLTAPKPSEYAFGAGEVASDGLAGLGLDWGVWRKWSPQRPKSATTRAGAPGRRCSCAAYRCGTTPRGSTNRGHRHRPWTGNTSPAI